ncbi:MAG TPA: hypothetical protein VEU52_03915 [Candidatus Limnocylindrales bacterium]|nr:hypothetical protein [Candidatus Limnocylindrales bacterium]
MHVNLGEAAIRVCARIRSGERGGGKLNLLLTLIVVGFLVFAAIKIVPVYVNNYELQDSMETEARFAVSNRKTPVQIREDVWKKVVELGVPAKQDSLKVSYGPDGTIQLTLDYTVAINLIVYQWNKDFHIRADNHSI